MKGTEELAAKINEYLMCWTTPSEYPDGTYLIENECPRFQSGDGKRNNQANYQR